MTGAAVHKTANNVLRPILLHIPGSPAEQPQEATRVEVENAQLSHVVSGVLNPTKYTMHVLTCGFIIAGGGKSERSSETGETPIAD